LVGNDAVVSVELRYLLSAYEYRPTLRAV